MIRIQRTPAASGAQAFIGHKSKMRSCRLVRLGADRLRCEMTWRYRFLGVIVGLFFGLLLTSLLVHDRLHGGRMPQLAFLGASTMAAISWLVFLRSLLFRRSIEIDGNAGTIELVQRGWFPSKETLPISQVTSAQAEKVVRLTDNTGGDNQWNRTECWLLRLRSKDGESSILCETTEQSVIDEMASFLSTRIEKNDT